MSIGHGGHINDLDFQTNGASPIVNGLLREICEEFHLDEILDTTPVGVLNDNSNDVGKVHFGLVYLMRVSSTRFSVAEEGKHVAGWALHHELEKHYDRMESWSQIVMEHLIRPAYLR